MTAMSGGLVLASFGALALGLRHGLDADHLAAIDGMTRLNALAQRRFARYCGVLFALGHGLVLIIVANVLGTVALDWRPPTWLEIGGGLISVVLVGMLGAMNLRAVLNTPAGAVTRPVGYRSRLFGFATAASRPWTVVLTGALFALSFDTLGLASFFAVAAAHTGGSTGALLLGALFTGGMLILDGANGLWVASLLARADARAVAASRLMGFAVSGVSLLVAVLGGASLLLPDAMRFIDDRPLLLSAAAVLIIVACFWAGRISARSRRVHQPES
jgi:high-affinity nickel-transport protein